MNLQVPDRRASAEAAAVPLLAEQSPCKGAKLRTPHIRSLAAVALNSIVYSIYRIILYFTILQYVVLCCSIIYKVMLLYVIM